jgi:putative SOS response-associated peptidase YedK
MQWGFVREWPVPGGKPTLNRLFNVRSETIDVKPSFATAYRRTRAIVPASAWYELPEKGSRVRLARGDGELIALAGLWERAIHPRTGAEIVAFTMAMTEGNAFTSAFHDRMPCLLDDDACDAWLDPTIAAGKTLLAPYPRGDLVAERQSTGPSVATGVRREPPRTGDLF